jgi:hypothetical protein
MYDHDIKVKSAFTEAVKRMTENGFSTDYKVNDLAFEFFQSKCDGKNVDYPAFDKEATDFAYMILLKYHAALCKKGA